MIVSSILIVSFIAIAATALLNSPRSMNLAAILYSLTVFLTAGYFLLRVDLPIFFFSNHYFFIDTLSIYEILIAGLVFLLAAIYSRGYVDTLIKAGKLDHKNLKLFYVSFSSLLFTIILVFSANNLALLWIFAELTTLLSAMLIVILNAKENITAAIKYIFITSTAMLFSFIGLIFLFAASLVGIGAPTLNWSVLLQSAGKLPPNLLLFAFVLVFIGFAAKSGIAPFHTWLPQAHANAPSDVSVLLSSSILNIGIYAILRMHALVAQTVVGHFASAILLGFGIITIAIAALSMVVRTNLKKLIAFSSIENMGIMLIGISVGSIFWVLYHTLAHALAKTLLFFSAGVVHRQYHSIKEEFIHALLKYQPLASAGLILGFFAVAGMPLFPIFISKFYILAALSKVSLALLFFALLMLIIVAGSSGRFMMGLIQNKGKNMAVFKAPLSMKIPIVALIIILLILGIYFPELLRSVLEKITLQLGG